LSDFHYEFPYPLWKSILNFDPLLKNVSNLFWKSFWKPLCVDWLFLRGTDFDNENPTRWLPYQNNVKKVRFLYIALLPNPIRVESDLSAPYYSV
jgi:hypothetical protein